MQHLPAEWTEQRECADFKERSIMKRRKFLKDTAFAAAALSTASLYSQAADPKKPNVIVILTDDQGYGDFSCHGNPVLKTPCMDRLAAEAHGLHRFSRNTRVYADTWTNDRCCGAISRNRRPHEVIL
jgi:hypothetical protein